MSPESLAEALRDVASRIDASSRPSRRLVAKEVRRVLAAVEDEVMVYVTISWSAGTKGQAVEAARKLMGEDGHKAGRFEEEQDLGDSVAGNIGTDEAFWEALEEEGLYEATDGNVTVTAEAP